MNVSISRDGVEIGEWPEEEVRAYFKEGRLLPTDYYWKEGMTEWSTLDKFIKPPPPASIKSSLPDSKLNTKSSTQVIPQADEEATDLNEGLKGSGANQLDPIFIKADSSVLSAAIQNKYLDYFFGKVGYDPKRNQRLYRESPHGLPGNKDLCQTLVTLNNEVVMTVWFDLSAVSAAEQKREKYLEENQLVIDRSEKIEPVEELETLNKVREHNQLPLLGTIEGETSTIENYGNSNTNPITVMGLIGLAGYIKSLRFLRFKSPIIATYKCSLLQSKEIRKTVLDEYPVDVFDVSCGTTKQSLLFCIYGASNDALYPKGFHRLPFDGKFDFKITDYLKFPQTGYLDGITKNGLVTCAFVKHDKRQLQFLLNKDKIESCPWQELTAHCSIFGKLL
jgi:hypothetical protein